MLRRRVAGNCQFSSTSTHHGNRKSTNIAVASAGATHSHPKAIPHHTGNTQVERPCTRPGPDMAPKEASELASKFDLSSPKPGVDGLTNLRKLQPEMSVRYWQGTAPPRKAPSWPGSRCKPLASGGCSNCMKSSNSYTPPAGDIRTRGWQLALVLPNTIRWFCFVAKSHG